VKVAGTVRANNGDLLKQLAMDGIGLLRQPGFLVGDEIRAGRLVEVLQDYTLDPIGIYAVYPSRKHLSAKIRTFVDYLAEHLPGQLAK
jgi:DNA-binding transcriptional LysR family regulator